MVDGAFWKQHSVVDESGAARTEWVYVTDEEEVEAEALRHVSRMFPPQLMWEPYKAAAIFPEGYAFKVSPVVSERLSHILTRVDRVDFTGALDPMTLAEFRVDALLCKLVSTASEWPYASARVRIPVAFTAPLPVSGASMMLLVEGRDPQAGYQSPGAASVP